VLIAPNGRFEFGLRFNNPVKAVTPVLPSKDNHIQVPPRTKVEPLPELRPAAAAAARGNGAGDLNPFYLDLDEWGSIAPGTYRLEATYIYSDQCLLPASAVLTVTASSPGKRRVPE
jgi:hypothetical protein